MATLYTVLAAIEAQVSTVTTGLVSNSPDTTGAPLNVMVGIGWPSQKTLQNNVRGGPNPSAAISIYDRGLAHDTTRWLPQIIATAMTKATVTATPSAPMIPGGGSIVIAVGGTVTVNDAIGLVLTPGYGNVAATVAIGGATDTPTTMAQQLAALVNADPDLSAIVLASSTSANLTLQSKITVPIGVAANVGNNAIRSREVGRRSRSIQIAVWTRTEDDRITVGDPIETMIASLEADFGLTFPDGTMGRVTFAGDHQMDDATLSDTYRRDFLVSVEYGITATDTLYAVLAPVIQNTTL